MTERYLSTTEAAAALNVGASTLRRWILKYKLVPTQRTLGGHYRWEISDLRRQIEEIQRRESE